MGTVSQFVIEYLEREYKLPKNVNLDDFNYVKTGFVDSIGVVKFLSMLEDEFDIEFTDDELEDSRYQVAGEIIKLVEKKKSEK